MKFKFAFEKVLTHKHMLEDEARREWAAAQELVDKALGEIKGLYDAIDLARERCNQLTLSGAATGPQLGQTDEFIRGQKVRIDHARMKARDLMAEAERRHELLVEAAKERKTFEKLRERRLEDFKKKRKAHELKVVDELVVMRAARVAQAIENEETDEL